MSMRLAGKSVWIVDKSHGCAEHKTIRSFTEGTVVTDSSDGWQKYSLRLEI
jgi:hypothetical protein